MNEPMIPEPSERRMIYAVWDGIMNGETEEELIEYVRSYQGRKRLGECVRRAVKTNVIRHIRRFFVWR